MLFEDVLVEIRKACKNMQEKDEDAIYSLFKIDDRELALFDCLPTVKSVIPKTNIFDTDTDCTIDTYEEIEYKNRLMIPLYEEDVSSKATVRIIDMAEEYNNKFKPESVHIILCDLGNNKMKCGIAAINCYN